MAIEKGSTVRVIDSVGVLSGQEVEVVSIDDLKVKVKGVDGTEVELDRDRVSDDLDAPTQDFVVEEKKVVTPTTPTPPKATT